MIRPLADRVLIRPMAQPTMTDSGLILAEQTKPDMQGTIVAMGDCLKFPDLQIGDHVVFSWASGQDVIVDQERYLVMREADVLAVIEELHV